MHHAVQVAGAQFATDPNAAGDDVMVLTVQRPAEIVNYQATGDTPNCWPPFWVLVRRSPLPSSLLTPSANDEEILRC